MARNGQILVISEFPRHIEYDFPDEQDQSMIGSPERVKSFFNKKMKILVKNGQILATNGQILVISEFFRHEKYNFFEEKHIGTTFIPKI